jgi:large subunit ribosomal protein L21
VYYLLEPSRGIVCKNYFENLKKTCVSASCVSIALSVKAVISTQEKQSSVIEGDILLVDHYVGSSAGSVIEIRDVFFVGEGTAAGISTPDIGSKVKAKILENKRTKKAMIFKKKRRKRHQPERDHCQKLSVIKSFRNLWLFTAG